ncbi:ImmA/IrrE family metallo-endopeptidase, partial [Candidatus Bathyarchaeota archaeon]|nr:ImmA/IrrE family metallo-endopeptidase [Candidatus Bathyarchaeota archaeon]
PKAVSLFAKGKKSLKTKSGFVQFTLNQYKLGHAVMDDVIYEKAKEFTIEEAIEIAEENGDDYEKREDLANFFAAAILMPFDKYEKYVRDAYKEWAPKCNFSFTQILHRICAEIAREFYVSVHIAEERTNETGFTEKIKEAADKRRTHLF